MLEAEPARRGIEALERKAEALTTLATDWRGLLFPSVSDKQFADGYAQAVTFGLLMARARGIRIGTDLHRVAEGLSQTASLIGAALQLLTDNKATRDALMPACSPSRASLPPRSLRSRPWKASTRQGVNGCARTGPKRHDSVMNRERVLALLAEHKPVLAERFGVQRLALFGSFARDSAREDSDVDVLVAFDGPATAKCYFGVQFYLEDLFGREVDLVTEDALRPRLRPYVERDAVAI